MPQRLKTDWILFAAVLALVLFGLLIVYSASSIMARMDARYNSSWYFVVRQAGYAVVAVVVMMALKRTHYRVFQNPAVAFGAIGVALMLLKKTLGAPATGGALPLTIDPSSLLAVLVMMLTTAGCGWAVRWECSLRSWPSRRW